VEKENKIDVWNIYGHDDHEPVAISIISHVEKWRPMLDKWMQDTNLTFNGTNPTVLTIIPPHLRFPMSYDPPEFIATFGRILQSRIDVRTMAATVLFALSNRYSLVIKPQPGIEEGKFYGMHLRTAADAIAVGWPSYEIQSANCMRGVEKSGLSTIYMATGSLEDGARFKELAAGKGKSVTTKTDLLEQRAFADERVVMQNLTWDQQGMVDYEVLLRSSAFSGMWESSFAWSVSNRRHVVEGKGTWKIIGEGHRGVDEKDEGPETFIDSYSTIYGPKDMGRKRWQFPLAMWP
jgi:hypothetical protein